MLKLPTMDTLVKQAIKANIKEFREAREEYDFWNAKAKKADDGSRDKEKYILFADQYFYEYVTIKHTLIRLFPDYEEKIIDCLYGAR